MKTLLFIFSILLVSISCSSDDGSPENKPRQRYCDGRKVTIDAGVAVGVVSITDESTWYPLGEDNTSILYIEGMSEGVCSTGTTSGNKPQFYVCDTCYYLD